MQDYIGQLLFCTFLNSFCSVGSFEFDALWHCKELEEYFFIESGANGFQDVSMWKYNLDEYSIIDLKT